jgi:hypothetical protein
MLVAPSTAAGASVAARATTSATGNRRDKRVIVEWSFTMWNPEERVVYRVIGASANDAADGEAE